MNEQQLKMLLTAEINDSAPDKDALWAKIEGRLQPKTAQPVEAPRKKPINLNAIRAAGIAAALGIPEYKCLKKELEKQNVL